MVKNADVKQTLQKVGYGVVLAMAVTGYQYEA